MSEMSLTEKIKFHHECKRDERLAEYLYDAKTLLEGVIGCDAMDGLLNNYAGSYAIAISNIAAMIQKEEMNK